MSWALTGGANAAAIRKRVYEACAAGERQAAEDLLETAQARVPRDTGALAASGRVEVDEDTLTATVAFGTTPETAKYAAIVHEDMSADHGDGQAKWLETSMAEARNDALRTIAREARRRL